MDVATMTIAELSALFFAIRDALADDPAGVVAAFNIETAAIAAQLIAEKRCIGEAWSVLDEALANALQCLGLFTDRRSLDEITCETP